MNKALFKAAIAAAGTTQRDLAKNLGIAETTVITKVKKNSFTISEAERIGILLNVSKAQLGDIFFT